MVEFSTLSLFLFALSIDQLWLEREGVFFFFLQTHFPSLVGFQKKVGGNFPFARFRTDNFWLNLYLLSPPLLF